jgi:GT2 family glycosyltransferase
MISVIIPNLHSPLIDRVIAALTRQTMRAQIADIIVVGQDRYGRIPPDVRFVPTSRPRSAAATRNIGARLASGDYLLFLDADCIAAPDLVEQMLACHQRGHAVVSGGITIETDNYWVLCDNILAFAPFLSSAPAGPRAHVPSLNLSIARSLFERLGGFDERFSGAAGEDMDLSLRLREQGYVLHFEPRSRISHRPQRTTARAVWQHLRAFGRLHRQVQRQHAALSRSPLATLHRRWWGVLLALSPLLALRDVLYLSRQIRTVPQSWRLLPGLLWGKLGWYWGVAEKLANETP